MSSTWFPNVDLQMTQYVISCTYNFNCKVFLDLNANKKHFNSNL